MKRLGLLALAFAIILFLPKISYAQEKARDDRNIVTLPAGETYIGDFYAFAETVEISGVVDGDVYAAGARVLIDGQITGDALVAGERVNITGEIGQDARILAFDTIVSGQINRNLTVVSFVADILSPSMVGRNAQIVADRTNIQGVIIGDTVSYSSEDFPEFEKPNTENAAKGINVVTKILSLMSTLILGFLLIKMFPNYTKAAVSNVTNKFAKSLLVGFAGLILFPAAILAMVLTIFALPLSIFTTALFIIYLFLTRIYVMLALGENLTTVTNSRIKSQNWKFILGLVIYYLLSLIPILGGLVKFVVLIAGFGAALMNEKQIYKAARKHKIF